MTLFLFYADPGSGAMLLQVLLAFFAGSLFYFRNFVKSLLGWGRTGKSELEGESQKKAEDIETNA